MATTRTPQSSSSGSSSGDDNGRRKPRRKSKQNPFWRKVKIVIQSIVIISILALFGILGTLAYFFSHAPSLNNLNPDLPGRTQIFTADGVLLAQMSMENRQVVDLSKVPLDLQHATIALEDRRFYEHSGVDVVGIMRALERNVRSGNLHGEGASTITQQLARNLKINGLTRDRTIKRKLHEWIVANQIEKAYTKNQILALYLNTISYGSGAYGVQAAAQTYFGKNVQDLTLAQCALLAGIPNSPNNYSPYRNKESSKNQRNIVLGNMLEQGYITQAQHDSAAAEPVKLAYSKPPNKGTQIYGAPWFVNYVISDIRAKHNDSQGDTEGLLEHGNLKIYTTLNWKMQQAAEAAVRYGLDRSGRGGPNQACLVALDPKSGEIKAMVGGADYKYSNYNLTIARRQPGSLFKLVVYSAAIDLGEVTEDTTVYDGPVQFGTGSGIYRPKDDNGFSYRSRSLKQAMAYSINVPAVKVLDRIGVDKAVQYAQILGIRSPLAPYLSLALGSSNVTPLEMTAAYATIANGGSHPDPICQMRITDTSDQVIDETLPSIQLNVLQKDTVTQIDDMLRAVVTMPRATGAGAGVIENAHGKTGTTQGHRDVWFIGYTPDLVCGVWAGHPVKDPKTGRLSNGSEMRSNVWGASVCVPIWTHFMKDAIPIFQQAKAKETARAKAAQGSQAPKANNGKTIAQPADENSNSDGGNKSNDSGSTDSSGDTKSKSKGGASQGVTVNIDNDTGLLAPAGSPNSKPVTFSDGKQPTQMAPAYADSSPDTADMSPDTAAPPAQDNANPLQDNTSLDSNPTPPAGDNSTGTSPTVDPNAQPQPGRKRRRRHSSTTDTTGTTQTKPSTKTEMVTVRINPEDGLLATKWCPEIISKQYVRGTEPHRFSHMYSPPAGEQ